MVDRDLLYRQMPLRRCFDIDHHSSSLNSLSQQTKAGTYSHAFNPKLFPEVPESLHYFCIPDIIPRSPFTSSVQSIEDPVCGSCDSISTELHKQKVITDNLEKDNFLLKSQLEDLKQSQADTETPEKLSSGVPVNEKLAEEIDELRRELHELKGLPRSSQEASEKDLQGTRPPQKGADKPLQSILTSVESKLAQILELDKSRLVAQPEESSSRNSKSILKSKQQPVTKKRVLRRKNSTKSPVSKKVHEVPSLRMLCDRVSLRKKFCDVCVNVHKHDWASPDRK